ncbi:MAG: glycosyltransferase [Lachnospiraceae bacterium]|nr:glycosyltransferase [Lachnospiraceae bacterium]
MSSIKVSVIIPVYRVSEDYFRDCLRSVMHQSLNDIEILLVDDGAPENIVNIMNETAGSDPRIRLLKQEHAGASAARNTGIAAACGEYITFVDSDDYIAEDNLEAAYDFAIKNQLEVAIWGTYKCYPGRQEEYMPFKQTIELISPDQKRDLMLKTMVGYLPVYGDLCTRCGSGSCCSKLYLRSFLSENDLKYPVGVMRSEDVNFNIRVYDKAARIGYLHRFFYYYRQLQESASYQYRDGGISVFEDALRELKAFIEGTGKDELFHQVYYMRCVFFFLESMDMDYLNPQNKKPLHTRLKLMKDKLNEELFSEALDKIDLKYLTFARRIPVFLMKHRMMGMLALFYRVYRMAGGK